MTNPFSKKEVPEATRKELDKRADADRKYFSGFIVSAAPKIRITSMCEQCKPEYNPLASTAPRADKAFGNTSVLRSREELALETGEFGSSLYNAITNLPKPAVTEIKISKQGELGTTRKTTITLLATSDVDLVELQKCYFIPGMSVRVEWGTFDLPQVTIPSSDTDSQANKKMRDITKTDPNYEGLQGLVTNFNYTLVDGQNWSCSMEIVSAAEALSESTIDLPCINDDGTFGSKVTQEVPGGDDQDPPVTEHRSVLYNKLLAISKLANVYRRGTNLSGEGEQPQLRRMRQKFKGDPNDISIEIHQYTGDERDPQDGSSGGIINTIGSVFTKTFGAGTDESYISWATFEAMVNLYSYQQDLGSFNSVGIRLTYHPSIESTDPRICIIPGTKYAKYLLDDDSTETLNGLPSAIETTKDGPKIILAHIRLNVIMLLKLLNAVEDVKTGDFKHRTYIQSVIDTVNSACGNLWELELISNDETDSETAVLSVVDIKFPDKNAKQLVVYDIPGAIYSETGPDLRRPILLDVSFNMKMTSAMKTQALYSGNTNGKAASADPRNSCAAVIFKPFGTSPAGFFKNLARKIVVYDKCPPAKPPQELAKTFEQVMKDLQHQGITDGSTSQAASLLRQEYANSVHSGKDNHCEGQPLPFELTLTLHGIGGFGFGQIITCNRIPEDLRNSFNWQVTSVEHSITAGSWRTQINTIPRYKSSK